MRHKTQSNGSRTSRLPTGVALLHEPLFNKGTAFTAKERDALGRSLPDWPVFPEVGDALTEAHERSWTLVALSNTDRDLIDASLLEIGAPFDRAGLSWATAHQPSVTLTLLRGNESRQYVVAPAPRSRIANSIRSSKSA